MVRTFLWDGENIIRQTLRDYTYNPQAYGELISQGSCFHHFDALGSTRQMTDGNEAVTNEYLYRAFGEETDLSGGSAAPNRFTWVGRLGYYREPDLNTYWLRARVYEPARGRFISRDAARDDTNLYRWPGNSPVVLVDPSGRQVGPKQLGGVPTESGWTWAWLLENDYCGLRDKYARNIDTYLTIKVPWRPPGPRLLPVECYPDPVPYQEEAPPVCCWVWEAHVYWAAVERQCKQCEGRCKVEEVCWNFPGGKPWNMDPKETPGQFIACVNHCLEVGNKQAPPDKRNPKCTPTTDARKEYVDRVQHCIDEIKKRRSGTGPPGPASTAGGSAGARRRRWRGA